MKGYQDDKNIIRLPRQNANPILQYSNNQGYKLIAQSFYQRFTTLIKTQTRDVISILLICLPCTIAEQEFTRQPFLENLACQGASEAIRRRAILDAADEIQSRMEKEGIKRHAIFYSLLITFLLILIRYACLVVISNPATKRECIHGNSLSCVQAFGKNEIARQIADTLSVFSKHVTPCGGFPLIFQVSFEHVEAVDNSIVA